MSAARTFCILISLMALMVTAVFIGCSPDRTGQAVENMAPIVYIVNTPPDSAQFSRNPDLNWYATDYDGYITMYRYAVVVDSMMVIGGVHVTPDVFVEQATDAQFGWDTMLVTLDNTQTSATIRLYANRDFPIDSFVTQYFFIQARDDRDAMSDIVWRMYSRNNHFPNTHFRTISYYINAVDAFSPAPGISLSWEGADSLDWGRAEPPLEYEWRLFGPFTDDAILRVNLVQENCIYDPTLDTFVNCLNIQVLDLDNLPPAVNNMAQPLLHSMGPNYANDPSDVWVTETSTTLYDVYRSLNLTNTSKYKFVFWVRARDDGFVPDPTPSFGQFYVYEAKFENSVMVIDETGYTRTQGRWGPRTMDTVKAYFYNMLNLEMGYTDFDTLFRKDPVNPLASLGPEHFFYSSTYYSQGVPAPLPHVASQPELIDVLSHKVIIYFNDDPMSGPIETDFGFLRFVFQGLDMGASAWLISRNMANATENAQRGDEFVKSANFAIRFGFQSIVCEGWLGALLHPPTGSVSTFNEEFIGAYSNMEGFPHVMLDYGLGSLLDTRYRRFLIDTSHVLQGSPEIGIGVRTQYAAPLYLYLSRNDELSMFHGKVMSVIQQLGDMRTACFMYTPLAMDSVAMRQVFDIVMPWLSAKFEDGAKSSTLDVPSFQSSFADLSERRARLEKFLRYMSEDATPEEKAAAGMPDLIPFEVNGGQ